MMKNTTIGVAEQVGSAAMRVFLSLAGTKRRLFKLA